MARSRSCTWAGRWSRVGGCALHTGGLAVHDTDGPAFTPQGPVSTVDYHTAGEPFRIVVDPGVAIRGRTVAERRVLAQEDSAVDGLRRLLCFEPRGHADMYGGFLTAPDDEGAHLGVLFWHKDGFSTACGHGTIALGVWAVETGLVPAMPGGATDVVVDVPSGRVTARVAVGPDGWVTGVCFVSVPSYVLAERCRSPRRGASWSWRWPTAARSTPWSTPPSWG